MTKISSDIDPKSITIFKGISIYKVTASKYWYVRVWDRDRKKYTVRATGETSSILAKKAAQDLAISMLKEKRPVEREFTFKIYCLKLLKTELEVVAKQKRSVGSYKAMKWCIENDEWGLIRRFGDTDIREITTRDFREYMNYLDVKNPNWAPSSKNTILATDITKDLCDICVDIKIFGDCSGCWTIKLWGSEIIKSEFESIFLDLVPNQVHQYI